MQPKITISEAAQFLNVTNQAISKKLKQKSLKSIRSGNKVAFSYSTSKEIFQFDFKNKVIAMQIVKGGVGKTAMAMSIASRASVYGAKTLCIDLDQQANLTNYFGIKSDNLPIMIDVLKGKTKLEENLIEVADGLHLFPSRIDNAVLDDHIMIESLRLDRVFSDHIIPLKKFYDLIIIDCPPSLGRSVAAAALAADYIIAPLIPDSQCLIGLNLLEKGLKKLSDKYNRLVPFKILFNKFDGRTTLSRNIITHLLKHKAYRDCLFKTYVRQNQDFANSCAKHESIFDSIKPSTAKEDIDFLTQEILDIVPTSEEKNQDVSIVSLQPTSEEARHATA